MKYDKIREKILVSGGAGFIGSNIIDALIEVGHKVVIIDNLSTGFRKNLNPEAKFYEVDIRDKKVEEIFARERPEVVIHLAAQIDVRASVRNPVFDSEVNIGGTINLLENCVKYKVRKIIYSNTGGALYGRIEEGSLPVNEKCPVELLSQYAVSKYSVEHYLYLYNKNYGLDYTSLRYSNVYGDRQNPEGEAGVIAIFINNMKKNENPIIFGDGKQTRDYVYVKDVVKLNLLALEKGNNEIFNIGSGKQVSVLDIFDSLKELLSFKGNPIFKPERLGEIKYIALDSTKALNELGWKAETDFSDGIKKTLDYYARDNK
ncbi:MAG: NAD-dependent epimerase/dehydratase family protein [archaeon]